MKILNLGCNTNHIKGMINVDINPECNPDVVCDIQQSVEGILEYNSFDKIRAYNVLEHIRDIVPTMHNCMLLLKEGGIMDIVVPYELSYGAWEDPTHVRTFNERSFTFYWERTRYLGWKDEFGLRIVDLQFTLFPWADALKLPIEETIRIPRAVDWLMVTLKKDKLCA